MTSKYDLDNLFNLFKKQFRILNEIFKYGYQEPFEWAVY